VEWRGGERRDGRWRDEKVVESESNEAGVAVAGCGNDPGILQ
jgi:hypothetical protein